ncbi:MAG: SGNH/GDSL hydrolase family protein [Planctomycetes bacterium]|nr:SGNH/GDSL hydrolase family protein [Planctomycetota bacterium]
MPRTASRMLALALGTLAALACVLCFRAWRASAENAEQEAQRDRILALVEQHAHEAPRAPEGRPFFLEPEDAARLFPRDHSLETYDPWTYFHHKPNRNLKVPWPEHPRGEWHLVTNSLGLREERELAAVKPALRVLVTGDSHTDGFCDASEAFPHVAEAALARERPPGSVEVINAGNGGFNFYNYLGTLERFLDLQPDAFVVAVYPGNDFLELLLPRAWFEHEVLEPPSDEERAEYGRIVQVFQPAYVQYFGSLSRFHRHSELAETSVATATELMLRMRGICDEHGIRFLCMLIPAAIDVPRPQNQDLYQRLREATTMEPSDLQRNDQMADALLARLSKAGCETLDTRPILRAGPGPWYWAKDQHLNVAGNAALGAALAARIRSWGGRFAR